MSSSTLSEDAPLYNLLTESPKQLTDEELRERVSKLRDVSSNAVSLKNQIKAETKSKKKTGKKRATKDDAKLTEKYLNFGKD